VLDSADLSFESQSQVREDSYQPNWTLDELERFHISAAYLAEDKNVEKTASRLGIARSTLYQKLKSLNLT
jgi:transcriptional regulator of acetoin/glycerol metabolism